jgi:hypothetical protein
MSTRRGLQILLALILFVIIGALLQGCATSPCTVLAEQVRPIGTTHEGQPVQVRAYLEVCPVVH